jgi:mRNA interferase MazF
MEIWFAKLKMDEQTCVQGGSRPVLIVSNNSYNEHSQTVNVLPMTSRAKKRSMPSHTWIESKLVIGLKTGSMVLAEQVTTIDKSQLEYRMGECTDAMLKASIDKNIRIQLGLEDI